MIREEEQGTCQAPPPEWGREKSYHIILHLLRALLELLARLVEQRLLLLLLKYRLLHLVVDGVVRDLRQRCLKDGIHLRCLECGGLRTESLLETLLAWCLIAAIRLIEVVFLIELKFHGADC